MPRVFQNKKRNRFPLSEVLEMPGLEPGITFLNEMCPTIRPHSFNETSLSSP